MSTVEHVEQTVPESPGDQSGVPGRYGRWSLDRRAVLVRRPKKHKRPTLVFAMIWIAVTLLVAILANWLPVRNPVAPIGQLDTPPHWGRELFGLDSVGRSVVSRLIFGARTSYLIAIGATAVSLFVGCAIGLLAVYFRGVVDFVSNLLCNIILSIPGMLVLLTIAVVAKPSYIELILSISVVFLPGFIRMTRATGLSLVEELFIVAATGLGARPFRIIVREMLPNTLVSLVTYAGIVLPHVMLIEGGLSYLGFGVPVPTASWGQMIASAQPDIATAPWQAFVPAIVFALNVFCLYTLADWLRAKVDLKGLAKTT